jgi:hypothetical protein
MNLADGETKRYETLIVNLISARVAAIEALSEQLAEARHELATLTLLRKRVMEADSSARDSAESGGE